MKDIKTKEVTTKPKTKNPASRIPKELMRTAILESKEKSQTIANARDNDMGEQSPSEYASGKVTSAEEWAARKSGRTVTRAGKTAAQTSYEKIKQRAAGKKEAEKEAEKETARGTGDTQTADPASRETPEQKSREVQIQKAQRQKAVSDAVKTKEQKIRAARETPRIQNGQEMAEMKQLSIREQSRKKEAKDTVRQTAIRQKQPETIRIKEKPRKQPEPKTIQKRTIKTAPQSAKISVQPEQKLRATSSNALTVRMQKQMERRAAKQAAKKAAMQTSNSVRRMQKTARAGQNTFKAAKAAVEAAAKTVQSMMAALGAAGAVIVLLLVIMVGIVGGAAFSGSSESSEALSQEVLSYTATIQKYANQYGIPEYVSVIQAIMMQESGGRGTDPMQSSECPYNTRYANSPNAIQDTDYSIQVGIQYYADCLKEAGCTSPQDMDKLKLSLQGYAIIVTLSLIIVLSFYLFHRREVTRLSQKLQTLLHSFTHAELTLDFPSSDITDLVNALNELLRVYHKQVYSLQKKDEAIKETITNLAHDLRTPVTAIQGYTQMLLQSPELSEEDLDAAAVINERLNVLNQLLNQLFEFARIEADEMEFSYTTFDLNAVLRSVAVSFFKSFEERKIIPALSIAEISFPFYGDEKAVTRIFENIISNALSHGKSDYHFSSYDDNENYHFSFQNFTDSINESDIDKIFNRFYTTDLSRSRKTTGLGLTIAKNLTVKMGGSISASLNNNVFEIVVCFPKQKG